MGVLSVDIMIFLGEQRRDEDYVEKKYEVMMRMKERSENRRKRTKGKEAKSMAEVGFEPTPPKRLVP